MTQKCHLLISLCPTDRLSDLRPDDTYPLKKAPKTRIPSNTSMFSTKRLAERFHKKDIKYAATLRR